LIDPFYLSWLARAHDFETNFITLAAETNESMPFYVRDMVIHEVAHLPKSITDVKALVLGVAFKRDVDDTRHSPALKVIELLLKDGLEHISYNDPFVPSLEIGGKKISSVELSQKQLHSSDIVIITTDHTEYDYEFIAKHAPLIIDTRNATKKITDETLRKKIVLLGAGEQK
jgi:UDP-N-acetyl-D-glucosamine dehydrogenase